MADHETTPTLDHAPDPQPNPERGRIAHPHTAAKNINILRKIFSPDRPWRRAAEVAAVLSLACGVYALYRQSDDKAPQNAIPTATAAPPGQRTGTHLTATLDCVPGGCFTRTGTLSVAAHISGALPTGHEIQLASQDETTRRWFLHGPVVPDPDGHWSGEITINGVARSTTSQRITICAIVMSSSRAETLTRKQRDKNPAGLSSDDLPDDQLTCIPATLGAQPAMR